SPSRARVPSHGWIRAQPAAGAVAVIVTLGHLLTQALRAGFALPPGRPARLPDALLPHVLVVAAAHPVPAGSAQLAMALVTASTRSARARATRERIVPTGTASTAAASTYDRPSTWVRANAARRSGDSRRSRSAAASGPAGSVAN